MKAKLFAIGLFLFALAACVQRAKAPEPAVAEPSRSVEGPTYELQSIDSLMWRQPDSALTRLLPWFDTCCRDTARHISTASAYNRHYANLLLSELLYKNDYPQTNRAELQRAVAYFDSISQVPEPVEGPSNRIAFLDARAHYINGVGYYEYDSAVSACKEYLKALEVMEEHFEEKELTEKKAQFMALNYTHLSGLYSDLYLHEQSVFWAKSSLTYYQKHDHPLWHSAWILNNIGSNYNMMNQSDSATYYYQKAMDALDDTTTLMYRDIVAHLICLEYKEGICQADAATKKLLQLLQNSESERESQIRYMYIGEVFYHEHRYDSAWTYLNAVFHATDILGIKRQAAEWLIEICKTCGRNDEILEYAKFLVPFANQEENQSEIKSQLTELYNSYRQASLSRQHQQALNKNITISMIVFAGLIAGLLVIIIFYRKNKQSKQKLEMQMEAERHAHRMQQAALAGRLRQSNAALKEQDKIKSSVTPLSFGQDQNVAENYTDEPICRQILSVCNDKSNPIKSTVPVSAYVDIALNDAQKAQLREAALRHYGALFEKLRLQYPEMKEKDFLYCYLCLLGLDNVQIAVLLQNSTSTIWERENRLKKIFGSENKIAIVLFGLINN